MRQVVSSLFVLSALFAACTQGASASDFLVLPTRSCQSKVEKKFEQVMRDRTTVVDAYIDAASPKAVMARRIDRAYSGLSDATYDLLDTAVYGTLTPPISEASKKRASGILSAHLAKGVVPSLTQPINNFDESTVFFQCFIDDCGTGGECTRVDTKSRAQEMLRDIANQKAFLNETLVWAREARRPTAERLELKRKFQNAQRKLRRLATRAPSSIGVFVNKVPR